MESVDMAQLGDRLGFAERLFVTRENGELVYPYVIEHLQHIPDNQGLLLIFPPDQLLDASFADECIVQVGRQLISGKFGHRVLLLQGLTDNSIKNVNSVVALHQLTLGFLAVEPTGAWQCVGRLGESLLQALNVVAERRQVTAPELADGLDLEINTASNRLKRLHDGRLIWREYEITERGLRYIYHFWDWTSSS